MTAKDAIRQTYGLADLVLNAYLGDLSDADLFIRPVPGQNHIAWQLGHLINSERDLVEQTRPGSCPPLPEGFAEAHANKPEANKSDDTSRFYSKARYLELLATQRAATLAALAALPDAELDTPAPEDMRSYAPTVGSAFLLVGTHYLMHAGQFVGVRRKLAKPIMF